MKDLILSSKKILIALPDNLCIDIASASLALAFILSKDKEVQIGTLYPISYEFSHILDLSRFPIINNLSDREIVISLEKSEGEIKAVRWREIQQKVQFIITPKDDRFEFQDININTTGGNFDLIITIGVKNLESLGNLYNANKNFFHESKIINIDINPNNTRYGVVNEIGEEQSVCSWMLKLAERENLEVTKEAAEALFKGVFWSNEGFRSNGGLKKALEKFTQTGGELTETINQIYDTLSLAELRYMGKIIESINFYPEKLLTSRVRFSEMEGVDLRKILYPEINIISRVKDYKVAFLLSEYEPGKVFVRVYSRDESLDVFEIFSRYTPIGNMRRVTFNVEGNIDELEQLLLRDIKLKASNSQKENLPIVQEEGPKENYAYDERQNETTDQNSLGTNRSLITNLPNNGNSNDIPNPSGLYKPPLSPATQGFNSSLPV